MEKLNKKGRLIIMSGPSGVGKGTIREIIMKDENLKLFYSVSMTTRGRRPNEVEGKDYYYVSKEEFMKQVAGGNLLEWTEYVGNCYGTPKDKVEAMLLEGKNVLLEIDVKGACDVLRKTPEAESIYIAPPSIEDLEARLRGRGTESEQAIVNRVNTARNEMNYIHEYKYVIVNDELGRAVNEVKDLIKSFNLE